MSADKHKSHDSASKSALGRVSAAVDGGIVRAFTTLGGAVSSAPAKTVLLSLVVLGACLAGITQLENESRSEKLWVPSDGTDVQHLTEVSSSFAPGARRTTMYIVGKNADGAIAAGTNVLTEAALLETKEVLDAVYATKVTAAGEDGVEREWTFDDLCLRRGADCVRSSVLDAYDNDAAVISAVAAQPGGIGADLSAKEAAFTITPSFVALTLGGVAHEGGEDTGDIVTAAALRVEWSLDNRQYLTPSNEYIDPPAEAWELAAFDALGGQEDTQPWTTVVVLPEIPSVRRQEAGNAIRGDLAFVSVSIMLIVAYLVVQLGNCSRVGSRTWLALGGVAAAGMSLGVAYGVGAVISPATPIHTVLAFLVFGIAADDLFVIVNEYDLAAARYAASHGDRRPSSHAEISEVVGYALGHAGSSITVTSLTNAIAFFISANTILPALSSFCIWAAISIIAAFFFSVTFFTALLTYDARRQAAGRADCCPCCVVPASGDIEAPTNTSNRTGVSESADELHTDVAASPSESPVAAASDGAAPVVTQGCCGRKDGEIARGFIRDVYAPFLMRMPVKAVVLLVFVGLAAAGVYGTTQIETEFRQEWFLPGDSFLQDYYAVQREFFSDNGVPVGIYAKDIEPAAERQFLVDLREAVDNNRYIDAQVPVRDWFEAFTAYESAADKDVMAIDKATFDADLQAFVADPMHAAFAGDIVFDSNAPTRIKIMRWTAFYIGMSEAAEELAAMLTLTADVEMVASQHSLPQQAYPFAFAFTTWRQFEVIPEEAFNNCVTALIAVGAVLLVFIAKLRTALLVTVMIGFVLADVVGFMHYWGVFLDSVSVVQLALALGLSVDYSVHIAHAFGHKHGTRDERASAALTDMGVSVLNGAMSTFLAVCVLGASKSYIFVTFFKCFALTCVGGALHGLVLLPVLLSLLGGDAHDDVHADGDGPAASSSYVRPPTVPSQRRVSDSSADAGAVKVAMRTDAGELATHVG